MQINKLLCIIRKLLKVVYEKTTYEDIVFVSENLGTNINLIYLHKLKNKLIQTAPKSSIVKHVRYH